MECEPTGVPPPDIVWSKDGQPIDPERDLYARVLRAGRILQIVAAAEEHAGVFTCTAKNVAGQEQRKYRLQVQGNNFNLN